MVKKRWAGGDSTRMQRYNRQKGDMGKKKNGNQGEHFPMEWEDADRKPRKKKKKEEESSDTNSQGYWRCLLH